MVACIEGDGEVGKAIRSLRRAVTMGMTPKHSKGSRAAWRLNDGLHSLRDVSSISKTVVRLESSYIHVAFVYS